SDKHTSCPVFGVFFPAFGFLHGDFSVSGYRAAWWCRRTANQSAVFANEPDLTNAKSLHGKKHKVCALIGQTAQIAILRKSR
ncbi:TPA: hypothetical protein ACHIE0_005642, partial [Escherichia coli]